MGDALELGVGGEAEPEELDANKFFSPFGSVFRCEARFSKKQPVPMFGAFGDGKEKVEGFSIFWSNFDS